MNIAFYVHSVSNGGAEKVASRLSQLWSAAGHRVVLLTQNPPADKEYAHQCVSREHVPYVGMTYDLAVSLRQKHGFDILVFNDSIDDRDFARVFMAFRRLAGLKIAVIIHHTANNWMYTTGCTQELGMDDLLSQTDAVISVDRMWALWWYHRGCPSIYIQNPVAVMDRIAPARGDSCRGTEPILVWVGRIMDWAKRPEKMIEAFVKINRQLPETRLVMLGAKTKAAEKALLKGVPEDVRGRISMPGFVTNADAYMRNAALHVFTSLTEVTVPQVVMEAQSLGLPTVALDMPVLRGAYGVTVAKNVEDLVELAVGHIRGGRVLEAGGRQREVGGLDVGQSWNELFIALMRNEVDELARVRRGEWQNESVYAGLLDELHRSQCYFAERYLPEYVKWRRWKTRLSVQFILQRLGEKIMERL